MNCPDCGAEVGDANFCASCGADLKGVREKLKRRPGGKTTGSLAGKSGGANGATRQAAAAAAVPAKGPSTALLWGIVGVVVVVVVVAVMLLTGDSTTGDQTGGGTQPAASATPVAIDTSGGYEKLVHRGNTLYNKGYKLFQSSQVEQGAEYFKAAAVAYMAAWREKPGDPNLGTDLATALFYSGNTEGALTQIDSVLKDNPEFQPALFNKGNYLAHAASFAEQSGQQKQADKLYAEAKRVLTKAIALDPASDVGKAADERLQSLPK